MPKKPKTMQRQRRQRGAGQQKEAPSITSNEPCSEPHVSAISAYYCTSIDTRLWQRRRRLVCHLLFVVLFPASSILGLPNSTLWPKKTTSNGLHDYRTKLHYYRDHEQRSGIGSALLHSRCRGKHVSSKRVSNTLGSIPN